MKGNERKGLRCQLVLSREQPLQGEGILSAPPRWTLMGLRERERERESEALPGDQRAATPLPGPRGLAASVAPARALQSPGPPALTHPGLHPSHPPTPVVPSAGKRLPGGSARTASQAGLLVPSPSSRLGSGRTFPLSWKKSLPPLEPAEVAGRLQEELCTCLWYMYVCLGVSALMCASKVMHAQPAVCSRDGCAHVCKCACVCCVQCVSVHGVCLRVCVYDCACVCETLECGCGEGESVGTASTCLSSGTQQPPSLRDSPAPGSPTWHRGCPRRGDEVGAARGHSSGPAPTRLAPPPSAKSVEPDPVATGVKSPPPARCSPGQLLMLRINY